MYYESNYLSHHGVKGMKWGVRKEPERKGEAKFYVNMLKTTAKVEAGIAAYQTLAGVISGDKKERYLQK